MSKQKMVLFIGNYFDGQDENYLYFVASEDCSRKREFKFAYKKEYGDQISDEDIRGIFPLSEAENYRNRDDYRIILSPKR